MSRRKRLIVGGKLKPLEDYSDSDLSVENHVPNRFNHDTGKMERNFPYHSYLGPGTDVRRRLRERVLPINKVDEAAMHHDVDYYNIRADKRKGLPDEVINEKIRAADKKLLDTAKSYRFKPGNIKSAWIATTGMSLKRLGEKTGVIDQQKYIGKGKGKGKDPCARLRKDFKLIS